jgi:hypothetical protein
MLERELMEEAKRFNIKITMSQENEPLGTGMFSLIVLIASNKIRFDSFFCSNIFLVML